MLKFITLTRALEIHRESIEFYGGSLGLRDEGLLESALNTPMATFGGQYLHPGLAEMAAAYLYHVVSNHPFVDGNKRAGLAIATVFLEMNDVDFDVNEQAYADLVLGVAAGSIDKPQVIEFFRAHVVEP